MELRFSTSLKTRFITVPLYDRSTRFSLCIFATVAVNKKFTFRTIRNVNFLSTATVAKLQRSNLEEDVVGKNLFGTGHPTGVQLCHGSPAVGPTRSAAAVSGAKRHWTVFSSSDRSWMDTITL